MAGVINTGSNPKALWPGIYSWWGINYKEHGLECKDLFDFKSSTKAYEEMVEYIGFGLAPEKQQGASVSYDTARQGNIDRFTNLTYGLGFIITEEEMEDNQYEKLVMDRTARLAMSARTTKEIVAANIYNRATSGSFLFGDGQPLGSASHPTDAGVQSNILSAAADLSEASLEDMVIQIDAAKDARGLEVAFKPLSLHIHPSEQFNAERILGSVLQNDTANNAVNAIGSNRYLPGGWKLNHYFDDSDQWFIRTDATDGMTFFQRRELTFSEDNDFDTNNMKYKFTERFVPGNGDWRAIYLTPGA